MVEHNLAKVGVAGSNPVSRSFSTGSGYRTFARVVELVDTPDLKSCALWGVRVQVPPRVLNGILSKDSLPFLFFCMLAGAFCLLDAESVGFNSTSST